MAGGCTAGNQRGVRISAGGGVGGRTTLVAGALGSHKSFPVSTAIKRDAPPIYAPPPGRHEPPLSARMGVHIGHLVADHSDVGNVRESRAQSRCQRRLWAYLLCLMPRHVFVSKQECGRRTG